MSRYFSAPEGQDLTGKLKTCHKLGFGLGFMVGATDAFLYSQSKTLSHTLQRMAFHMVPIYGGAMTYGSVTFLVARYRGKGNGVEHAAGALATAPIIHAWLRLPFLYTCQIVAGLVFIAVVNKTFRMDYPDIGSNMPTPINFPQYHDRPY